MCAQRKAIGHSKTWFWFHKCSIAYLELSLVYFRFMFHFPYKLVSLLILFWVVLLIREALLTLSVSDMQAALLVRGFPPKVGLFANFLYTHIVSLTGRQLFKDER
jgi:hypothetical protein